jgi:beta-glucanase (GH16 family)
VLTFSQEALGGNNAQIETNYFGKGDTSTYDRDTWPNVATPHDVFHTYTVKWTKDQMIWSVDGNVVRTLNYADAQGGARFPQTPMDIRIGIWAGGDSGNGQGTIDWAGGLTDYSKAPFSMYIKSVTIKNDNPAQSYSYNGNSGNADSIQVNGAGVTARSTTSSEPASTSTQASTSASTAASTEASTSAATTLATSAATTLATTTQGSSTAKSTEASSTAGSSSGVSPSSSGAAGSSGSGSSSQTGSQTGSGSSSSGSGSGSSSGSSTVGSGSSASSASASASSSPAFNAASSLASNYLGPISLMGLITAMLQL